MDTTHTIRYSPTPTAAHFHRDESFIRAVMGPVGSGKSVMCIIELLAKAMAQKPFNGVRKSRWALIRSTYPMLWSTTIKTFRDWIPHDICPVKQTAPVSGRLKRTLPDGTIIDAEFIFLALDRPQDIEKLKSLELTGAFMNEAGIMNPRILDVLKGRVGRYPRAAEGGWTWKGIIMDTNPPPINGWFYKLFELEKPIQHVIYKQPPPLFYDPIQAKYFLNPQAENVRGHASPTQPYVEGYRYWLDQLPGNDPEYIKTMILGQYGSIYEGRPVYTSWNSYLHKGRAPIHPEYGLDIVVGFDFGLMPAAVVTQVSRTGQLRVLQEIIGHRVTLKEFITKQVTPQMQQNYSMFNVKYVGDPHNDKSSLASLDTYQQMKQQGYEVKRAFSNKYAWRLRAVEYYLNRMEGFMVDPTCTMLIEGFAGGYRYKKEAEGELNKRPDPAKNDFSHPHDALQYAALEHYRAQQRREKMVDTHAVRSDSHIYA